jgi:hypothetical protein
MVDENRAWRRQSEAFWRAHHEAWKRSDLNQQYCEAEGIPLKAFSSWRAKFKAEPFPDYHCQPPSTPARRMGWNLGIRSSWRRLRRPGIERLARQCPFVDKPPAVTAAP